MPKNRQIMIVTGSRADFGLLKPVCFAIEKQRGLQLQLIATGTHLTHKTLDDIHHANLKITQRIAMQKPNAAGRLADVAAVGRGITAFAKSFDQLKPDVVLVLGDRIEAFAAASAASIGGIHVAHIHGGDRAQGVADEAMRHAITKLAHLHFPATRQSARRIARMGENENHIYHVGSPAIDGLDAIESADENTLQTMGVTADKPLVIILQHPVGKSDGQERKHMLATLAATDNNNRIVMAPNADPGALGILKALAQQKIKPVRHVTRDTFLSLLKAATVLVGNSSAGLIEASALGTPVVNIGPRQAGRQRPGNVINSDYSQKQVRAAIEIAMQTKPSTRHPYGDGTAGLRIAQILAKTDPTTVPIHKQNRY